MPQAAWKASSVRGTGASTAVRRAAVNASAILEPGTILGGRYEIILMLGIGGMGAVYKAYDRDIDRVIALKVIRPDLVVSTSIIQRFKQELILARQVTHRNVIRIYDLGEADGIKFITMEYIEGEPLTNILQSRGKLPPREAAEIIEQVGIALQTAHAEGVIHRDLKPANIMRDSHDRIVVMDFGLAHSMDVPITASGKLGTASLDATVVNPETAASKASVVGHLVGTPLYMSPEQARREEADWRSDIYTLGLIFYELLSGEPPFKGNNAIQTLSLRLEQKPKPLIEVDPKIPRRLNGLVARCLERAPKDRYQSMQELLSDLRAYLYPARTTWKWAAAGAAILVVAAAQIIVQQRLPRKGGAQHAPVSVLVADFKNQTSDSLFDGTLEPSMALALEGASFITSYDSNQARRIAHKLSPNAAGLDEPNARLVATREGVNVVVAGSISRDSSGYLIDEKAEDAVTGKIISHDSTHADSKDAVLKSVSKLAGSVRKALGDKTPESVQLAAAETFSSTSIEAAQHYARGQNLSWAGKYQDAVEEYNQAVKLDPDLGRAYSGLAIAFDRLGRRDQAENYYKLALSHIDRMSDREKYRTRGGYYLVIMREPDKAIEEFSQLVRQYPADTAGIGMLALSYFYKRDMPKALQEGRQQIEVYPNNVPAKNNVGLYAMYAGDFSSAIREQDGVLQLNPGFTLAYVGKALSQLGSGQVEAALATWEKLKQLDQRGASVATAGEADLALYEGRIKDAVTLLEPAVRADIAAKDTDSAALKSALLVESYVQAGQAAKAGIEADRATAWSKDPGVRLTAARAYIEAGQEKKALAIAADMSNSLTPDQQLYSKIVQGEVQLRHGNARGAIDNFHAALDVSDAWLAHFDLGRAYLAANAFTEADSEFETCLKRRGEATAVYLDENPSYHMLPQVHYYLGRAQEGLHSPAAIESYKTFLSIKEKGDETPLVADARKRAHSSS